MFNFQIRGFDILLPLLKGFRLIFLSSEISVSHRHFFPDGIDRGLKSIIKTLIAKSTASSILVDESNSPRETDLVRDAIASSGFYD